MKNKNIVCLSVILLILLIPFTQIISSNDVGVLATEDLRTSQEITPNDLIKVDFPIYIDGNWSKYVEKYEWCSGKGIDKDPYIIEGIHVISEKINSSISIFNTQYFIIRNVMVSNYIQPYGHYVFAGIYIEHGEYGLIDNCTIIESSNGISLANGRDPKNITHTISITNCNFIGSHDDPKTGMGKAIMLNGVDFGFNYSGVVNIENIYITHNDIKNFYDGIVVRHAEKVYVDNNRLEASALFKQVSDTGIYFCSVIDSYITNNDFYNCEPTTQDSDRISTSSYDVVITLDNCHNIEIYGNRFFDYDDLVDDENNSDNLNNSIPNYWIFILIGLGCFIGVIIFLYFLKKNGDIND